MAATATDAPLFWTATAILTLTYGAVVGDRINRAIAALLGASLTVLSGVLTQDQAIAAIDFNTLGLLAGMMIVVGVARKSGLFSYVAIVAAQAVRASPAGILMALMAVTAVFSAVLDNVTTVLLIVPVTFVICGELKVAVYPFLVAEILASNIGGAATLIGDPPNILIGSAAHLSFDDFLLALGPPAAVILVLQMLANYFIWGIRMKAAPETRAHLMGLKAPAMIQDRYLLVSSLAVIGAVVVAFVLSHPLHLGVATIALAGAAAMLLLEALGHPRTRHHELAAGAFEGVEWITLFFLIGLFVVVGGVQRAGLLDLFAHRLTAWTGGDQKTAAIGILWSSAVLSAIVDNIPFVATMIPVIHSMKAALGGEGALLPLWWALSLGACLGGNGTLVGASANLMVAGLAEKSGVRFSFLKFTLTALPMMLASVALAQIYLTWRYF